MFKTIDFAIDVPHALNIINWFTWLKHQLLANVFIWHCDIKCNDLASDLAVCIRTSPTNRGVDQRLKPIVFGVEVLAQIRA